MRHLNVATGTHIGMSPLTRKQVNPKNSFVANHLLLCNHYHCTYLIRPSSIMRFEALQKVVQYEKDTYSIKLTTICLKAQNCSKVLTKSQFTHINVQTLHVYHKTLNTFFFTEICDKASRAEIMFC